MANFQAGDAIEVVAREQQTADIKSQLYYPHYAGLRGSILKLYGEEASILVDRETLPAEVRTRHIENESAMRQRWLDGLSEEGRNRLNAREKQFTLNYAILIALKDLQPTTVEVNTSISGGKRATNSDLTAAEEAFLKQRAARA